MNAFTGHALHSTPFSSVSHFRTPLYSRWLSERSRGATHKTWPEFRDSRKPKKEAA